MPGELMTKVTLVEEGTAEVAQPERRGVGCSENSIGLPRAKHVLVLCKYQTSQIIVVVVKLSYIYNLCIE